MPADRTTDRSDLGLIQTGSGTKPPSRQRPTFHSMDTHAIALNLMRLATDALNSGQQIPHHSHRIVGNIYSAAPSHCRSSLINFRSIIAGFLNHLLLGFKECLDLCFVDQAALLPPTHNGHIPLDDETYMKHVESMQASIQNVFASSDSVAKDLPEMETVFISQLRSAAGLGSFINLVLPGISSCMSAIRDIPTSFTQLIETVRTTASSFAEFGRCMLDFHHLVRDFGWGTPVMSANLENLLFKLEGTALVLWRILFYMSGATESRSMMWLKLHEELPPADVPWPVLGDEDPCKDQDNQHYRTALVHIYNLQQAAAKKELRTSLA